MPARHFYLLRHHILFDIKFLLFCWLAPDGTVYVQGNSEYTITVSSYSMKADMSGATESTAWKDYEASKPSEL